MRKRILCTALCLLLFSSVPITAFAAGQYTTQGAASDALEALAKAWGTASGPGLKYPNDVAGLYITPDNRAAVVMVYGVPEARKNEIRALVPDPNVLVFISARYSYNELKAVADQIDTNGEFELNWWGVSQHERENAVIVQVTVGGRAAAAAYFTPKFGDKIIIREGYPDTLPILPPPSDTPTQRWLRAAFPKLRGMETEDTPFVFRSAPPCTMTRAVLNSRGETLTVYRFKTVRDFVQSLHMVDGSALVYGGKVIYADTRLPATWYANAKANAVALYCGADETVHRFLTREGGYEVAGGFGGYFDSHDTVEYNGMALVSVAKLDKDGPLPLSGLRDCEAICVGTIEAVSDEDLIWQDWPWGIYTVRVESVEKGELSPSVKVMIRRGEVFTTGKRYVFCLDVNKNNGLYWPSDRFEIDGRGYVLPVREYGMRTALKLNAFLARLG
ncbi:MAG TPA: hypothetical protein VM577_01885 [Anaerovoracaceae bacterium]|nr:hypothetical protein [Anaerovoracaceae bacterium]